MDEFSTYYDLFNLQPNSSQQDLKGAYKRLVKQWHPDRFANDPINLKIAEEKIKAINIAYEALKAHQEGSHFGRSTSGFSSHATSVKTRRTSPRDYFDDAKRLAQTGQYREAAEELSYAIKLEPKYAAAYHLRGILFTILGFERRGGSDLRKAAVLGVISFDYDSDISELVRTNDDFKYFRHLLKKEVDSDSQTNPSKTSSSSHPKVHPEDGSYSRQPKSKSSQSSGSHIKDIRQARQQHKRLKKEKLKQEKIRREQSKQKYQPPEEKPSAREEVEDHTPNPQASQDEPVSPSVEEVVNPPKSPDFAAKIQLDLDFSGQAKSVYAMAISANGKTLATGCSNGDIDLWNYKNKRNFHTLKGHIGTVSRIVFSSDNQLLLSGGEDGSIRLWNLGDGSFIRSFKAHDGKVTDFAVCHLRKLVITAGTDGVVRVWDLRESKLLREILHHEASIPVIALNATGEIVACGIEDGSMRFCHALRGGIVKWFTAHNQSIETLAFSQHGQTLASGSSSGEVGLWQFPSGDRRQVCQSAHSGITALSFCHQNRLLCGADHQGRLMVWDVASGALLDTVSAHSPGRIQLIAMADDTLLSAGADGCIRQWRLQIP
jgi:WD40 repeat protein